ncbi:hypothetical protein LSH36_1g16023 [Paralvinella palmiformis]|uniref:Uncharacterized protein n=1 Tax=Paralvinella palmiformis TaxID=53620 RepID=A0AAD9KGI6_9ANNE|nr:hypothetical protein LSH36_1g16023 [Paralvinella palmiformis]
MKSQWPLIIRLGSVSTVTSPIVWTMESTPSAPPLAVTVSVKSSTSILVSWMPPSRQAVHGTIRGYVVRVYFRNGTQPRVEKQVLANLSTIYRRHQAYIYGLKKYTGYNIMVSGYTVKGEGPQSRPVSVRTLEDVPGQVSSLTFDRIQKDSFTVTWSPPKHSNGILQGYTLMYEESNLPTTRVTKSLSPETLSYTADRLMSHKFYTVTLFASTSVGSGLIRTAFVQTISPSPASLEICHMNTPMSLRTLHCGPGLVIKKMSASYGRMKLGQCIRDTFGSIGCELDVTDIVREFCAGKKKCTLHDWFLLNRIIIPDSNITCPRDLPKYLQVTYECENDPCNSKPCLNDGVCTASEDPYNIGYYCYCGMNFGGRHCQIGI